MPHAGTVGLTCSHMHATVPCLHPDKPVHILSFFSYKITFNVIFLYTHTFSCRSVLSRFAKYNVELKFTSYCILIPSVEQ